MNKKKWLTVKEVMELTGQSERTVFRYIKRGVYESRQAPPGGKGFPVYVRRLSIPTYLRLENV